ncbi:hypothetical protein GCM10025865_10320 [Paraoerskovia sediminicola]|uniref:Uncharacterized protein n=1 Tax=Paraoerskovia sediminicola TaxID=1138587 RepID=A0ABN6XC81_9CELL|nr:hypothetical protein [Paraoerskovia sediminicola]BDZ41733.1 hypothetical protein GCM10025865_10320 [Paraoerskovia sediminicola]
MDDEDATRPPRFPGGLPRVNRRSGAERVGAFLGFVAILTIAISTLGTLPTYQAILDQGFDLVVALGLAMVAVGVVGGIALTAVRWRTLGPVWPYPWAGAALAFAGIWTAYLGVG